MDQNAPISQSVANPPQPTPSTPPAASTPAPMPGKKSPKKILIIIAAIFILIIVAVAVYLLLPKSTTTELPKTVNQPDATSFPYSVVDSQGVENVDIIKEMAQEISKYVLSQRRPDGYYDYLSHYQQQCVEENGEQKCPFNGVNMFETTNAWTALALFSGSQILQNPALLNEANSDLVKLEEYCALDRTQCNWVLAQPAIIYQTTQDPLLFDFLKAQGEVLLSSEPSENTMLVAIEARELALLYEITQDTRYIVAAQNRLRIASQKLNDQPDIYPDNTIRFAESSCWVSLANGELANATQNDQEKINTTTFLENGNISQNFRNFQQPLEIQPCIESFYLIGKSTETKDLLEKFSQGFYDGPKRKLIYGEGGTALDPTDTKSKFVVLTDSSYTLFLLNLLNNI